MFLINSYREKAEFGLKGLNKRKYTEQPNNTRIIKNVKNSTNIFLEKYKIIIIIKHKLVITTQTKGNFKTWNYF